MRICNWRRLVWAAACLVLPLVVPACTVGPIVGDAIMNAPFRVDPQAREGAVALAGAAPAPGRALAGYRLRIDATGGNDGGAHSYEVVERQSRGADGLLNVVSRTHGPGAWGMTRALSLCGLVALQLDTVLTDRAYPLADPAPGSSGAALFTAARRLEPDTRMRVAKLHADGRPCDPRPRERFSLRLETRSLVRGSLPGRAGAARADEVRYDCVADASTTAARSIHPALAGQALRVDCERRSGPDGPVGRVRYAWLVERRVYLLVAHDGGAVSQRYVYADVDPGS